MPVRSLSSVLYGRNAIRPPKADAAARLLLEARDFSRVRLHIYGRMRDDMIGWFFCTSDLFHYLEEMNCEAVYLKTKDKDGVRYKKFNREDFSRVESAYLCVLSEKRA